MPDVAINNLYHAYNPTGNWQEANESMPDTTSTDYSPVDCPPITVVHRTDFSGNKKYLWCLDSSEGEIDLSSPLEIIVSRGVDKIFVINDDLNITGLGNSIDEAIQDFMDFFIHDYFFYSESPSDQLDENSGELLSKYQGIISGFKKH